MTDLRRANTADTSSGFRDHPTGVYRWQGKEHNNDRLRLLSTIGTPQEKEEALQQYRELRDAIERGKATWVRRYDTARIEVDIECTERFLDTLASPQGLTATIFPCGQYIGSTRIEHYKVVLLGAIDDEKKRSLSAAVKEKLPYVTEVLFADAT